MTADSNNCHRLRLKIFLSLHFQLTLQMQMVRTCRYVTFGLHSSLSTTAKTSNRQRDRRQVTLLEPCGVTRSHNAKLEMPLVPFMTFEKFLHYFFLPLSVQFHVCLYFHFLRAQNTSREQHIRQCLSHYIIFTFRTGKILI